MDRITALEARVTALEQAAADAADTVETLFAATSAAHIRINESAPKGDLAVELIRSAGYLPPDEDAAPSMAVVTPKPSPAPAGATTQEKPMAKIKARSVVHHVSESYPGELGASVRDVAREAARQWGQEHVAKFTDFPEQFGKKVAEVYLAAAADLSEGFESDPVAVGASA